jgi:hypothetical protein
MHTITYRREAARALIRRQRSQPAKAEDIRSAFSRVAVDPSAANNNLLRLRGVPPMDFEFVSVIGGCCTRSIDEPS